MKLKDIIAIADKVYPDGLVGRAFSEDEVGDGLAEFIARELKDTYDPKASSLEQVQEAHRVMSRAYTELGDVAQAFSDSVGTEVGIKVSTELSNILKTALNDAGV